MFDMDSVIPFEEHQSIPLVIISLYLIELIIVQSLGIYFQSYFSRKTKKDNLSF